MTEVSDWVRRKLRLPPAWRCRACGNHEDFLTRPSEREPDICQRCLGWAQARIEERRRHIAHLAALITGGERMQSYRDLPTRASHAWEMAEELYEKEKSGIKSDLKKWIDQIRRSP